MHARSCRLTAAQSCISEKKNRGPVMTLGPVVPLMLFSECTDVIQAHACHVILDFQTVPDFAQLCKINMSA